MDSLTEISNTLDRILDKSLPEWGLEQISLYQLIEKKIIAYRKTFIQAQFRQDQKDITDNIYAQKWYKTAEAPVKKAIESFVKQMRIVTFSLTRQQDAFRMLLTASFEDFNLKLQYFNSPTRFLYYLYVESIDDCREHQESSTELQRAYLAKNGKTSSEPTTERIPDLESVYKMLGHRLSRIPAGVLMSLIREIIIFYDDTETVIKTPISQDSSWGLKDLDPCGT